MYRNNEYFNFIFFLTINVDTQAFLPDLVGMKCIKNVRPNLSIVSIRRRSLELIDQLVSIRESPIGLSQTSSQSNFEILYHQCLLLPFGTFTKQLCII